MHPKSCFHKTVSLFFYLWLSLSSVSAQLPALRISDNKRFLVTANGKPFFWMGDTGWELFHRLNRAEAEKYFKKRSEQGFNVIQAVALAELDGLHTPNANGDTPLLNDDPEKPNERYFLFIDSLVDLAATYHIYIALLPTWGDKLFKNKWGRGPEIFNESNAYVYGKWIGNRYRQRTNIIWIVGGDRNPRDGTSDVSIWRSLAKGLKEGMGHGVSALITFHPQPDGFSSSSEWFQTDQWLDFNMLQTGHCRDTPVWDIVSRDYNASPTKPVINGENIYEEMPVCFNPKDLGYSNALDTRKSAYLSVFAGAFGHVYGCGPVIWFSDKGANLFAPFHNWTDALDLPGANEMKYVRSLIESRNMSERIPDQSVLSNSNEAPSERIQATRGKDYIFIYSAGGKSISLNAEKINWDHIRAAWFDPRTGKTTSIGDFNKSDLKSFVPPVPPNSPVPSQKEDWVLVLDKVASN